MKQNAFDLTVSALRKQGLNSDQILEEMSKLFNGFANGSGKIMVNDDENRIEEILAGIYIPKRSKGYGFWCEAIKMYLEDPDIKMMQIYSTIAQKYEKSAYYVSGAMKYSVKYTIRKCPMEKLRILFGKEIRLESGDIPTNSEFLNAVLMLM